MKNIIISFENKNKEFRLNHSLLMSDRCIIIASILCCTAILWIISYFGSPLSDEGFPFAIAYRFILGQKPFIDDMSPLLSLGLLVYPLIKLSILLHHGTDKLILFLRHLFLFFSIIMGIYAYFITKRYLTPIVAFLIATMIVVYHHFGINDFHYHALGTLLWAVIIFQFYNFISHDKNPNFDYMLFPFLGIALFFSYPTFVFFLLPLYVVFSFFLQKPKLFWYNHIFTLLPISILMVWVIFGYFGVTFGNIKNTINFYLDFFHGEGGGAYKITHALVNLYETYSKYLVKAFLLLSVMFLLRKRKWVVPILLAVSLILPFFNLRLGHLNFLATLYFFNCFGFLGVLIFCFFLRHDQFSRRLFYFIWIPAFLAGILTTLSSAELDWNFDIGFFPGIIVGIIFIYRVMQKHCTLHQFNEVSSYWATRSIIVYMIMMTIFFQAHFMYAAEYYGLREFKRAKKYTVEGPFNGIYLDVPWLSVISTLQHELKAIDTDPSKYIYLGTLSGAYLLLHHLKPGDRNLYVGYFTDPDQTRRPAYLVIVPATGVKREEIDSFLLNSSFVKYSSSEYVDILYAEGKST